MPLTIADDRFTLLIAIGLVRSVTRPGERTTYYRILGDAWEKGKCGSRAKRSRGRSNHKQVAAQICS